MESKLREEVLTRDLEGREGGGGGDGEGGDL
jgi:hypothetical protein